MSSKQMPRPLSARSTAPSQSTPRNLAGKQAAPPAKGHVTLGTFAQTSLQKQRQLLYAQRRKSAGGGSSLEAPITDLLLTDSRCASEEETAPSSPAAASKGRAWLLPGCGEAEEQQFRDAAAVIAALAARGMQSVAVASEDGRASSGASLVVGCLDAILLKLENQMPYDAVASSVIRRAVAPVADAACSQIQATNDRRLQLLADIERMRENLRKREEIKARLNEMIETGASLHRSRKLREAAEAVQVECATSVKEKQDLEEELSFLKLHHDRLCSKLGDDIEQRKEEAAAWDEVRVQLTAERDEQAEIAGQLAIEVPQVEGELAELEDNAAAQLLACRHKEELIPTIADMEQELVIGSVEWSNLLTAVRETKFEKERLRKKVNREKKKLIQSQSPTRNESPVSSRPTSATSP